MTTMNELVTQSRIREVTRAAGHPARLAEHEVRLGGRRTRGTRTGDLVPAARAALPAAAVWLAALAATVS
jgi:hypothetical protein